MNISSRTVDRHADGTVRSIYGIMLRYPDVRTPYNSDRVEMLKQWSEADPPEWLKDFSAQ